MAEQRKPKPTPTPQKNLYGIDRSKTTTDWRQMFKGLVDFESKPTGDPYANIRRTSRNLSFFRTPEPMSGGVNPLRRTFLAATTGGAAAAGLAAGRPAAPAGQPATGGSIMENNRLNQVAANAAQQRMSNIPKPPGGIPLTRPGSPQNAPRPFTADDLYIDPTPAFQPVLDQYAQQQAQLQDRYGANQADIKNIFGTLSTVRAMDKTKIAQQYQTSIQQQQDALAARTAEARMGTQAGQQGAAIAAEEMGTAGQPAPTTSLTAQAAEQGIADANAYQTTWTALQNVMSQQAQNDVQNAVQGYDYQQTAALEALRNDLEDRLASINQNMAGTQSQLAQAQLEGRQNVANAKYGEAQDAKAQAAALAAAQARASAPKPKSYSKTASGWESDVTDNFGPGVAQGIRSFVTNQIRAIENTKDAAGKSKAATQSAVIARLNSSSTFAKDPALSKAIEYVQKYSGLPAR